MKWTAKFYSLLPQLPKDEYPLHYDFSLAKIVSRPILQDFYRPSACHILLMQSPKLLWHIPSVCPSVCPSHSGIVLKWMHILSNSYHILVEAWLWFFKSYHCYKISRGTTSAGVLNTRGWKNLEFLTSCHLSQKRYEIGPRFYGSLIGSHRQPIDSCQFQWPWVTLKGGVWASKFCGGCP